MGTQPTQALGSHHGYGDARAGIAPRPLWTAGVDARPVYIELSDPWPAAAMPVLVVGSQEDGEGRYEDHSGNNDPTNAFPFEFPV